MILPGDAFEEITALDGVDPGAVWRLGRDDTAFRRQMLPHADRDDPRFRIIVPVSGGLDSSTCYRMARAAGLPAEAVMAATGVPYARHDREAALRLTEGRLHMLEVGDDWQSVGDFQIGRNSIIVWRLLEWAHSHGWWGEVWFGHLGGNYLETPIVGGDKSFRWAATMQHLATAHGFDFRLSSPLIGMSKADCVSWWASRGMAASALTDTRSCFADIPGQCGRCWACLYRYVAFAARGYGPELLATYANGYDFAETAAEMRRRLAWDLVTTRPDRLRELAAALEKLGLDEGSDDD